MAFPLDERMQNTLAPDDDRALPGWRLTNDAVLIDTAGHYAQHGTSRYPISLPSSGTVAASVDTRRHAGIDEARVRADAEEWRGFLRLLRDMRPRMPINGALLTVNVAALTHADLTVRVTESNALRARLDDMRAELGVGFPVWLIVTKMDRLTGFVEYFDALGEQDRMQMWGFTLPQDQDVQAQGALLPRCEAELTQLAVRLADGVNRRLFEEPEVGACARLATLPEEFSALTKPLAELIAQVFGGSIGEDTSSHAMLRGVYLTSAIQAGKAARTVRQTVLQRMAGAAGTQVDALRTKRGNTGYFLHDLLTRVVFHEAHLVRPNARWEQRARLQRLVGHALVWLLAGWFATSVWSSFDQGRVHLLALGQKARSLTTTLTRLGPFSDPGAIAHALAGANALRHDAENEWGRSDGGFRVGSNVATPIEADGRDTYNVLLDRLLLPQVVRRMEAVIMTALASQDSMAAYDALRVYLMLFDEAKYNADDVKAWVLDDWAQHNSAAVFGGRAVMVEHVQRLFSSERVVQPPSMRHDAMIEQARAFVDGHSAIDRLYERAKAAMQKAAPDEFTLLRAVGPQAGTVFVRASGAPLNRGVPGLFTAEGYHAVFDKRLAEFVQAASDDDAWVMGRRSFSAAGTKATGALTIPGHGDDALTAAIRRRYLMEYAQQWDDFLGDIRTVSGTSLAFNLHVLRGFAAPNSPLVRLARAAVHETTLTQSTLQSTTASDGSFLQKTAEQLGQKVDKALSAGISRPVERELVDNHFAALREVVTGRADSQAGAQSTMARSGKAALDGVTNLLNDYYTALTVADNALSNNSLPPENDTAAKLKMTAGTMPAPFQAVLLQLASDGSREVNQGIGQLLSRQVQAAVGDTCRLAVEGNYLFAPDSKRDVSLDDFTRVFAQGGLIDDFFAKTLVPFVDTSARPWRYRTLPGATEPVHGPDLEPFEHARAIRDIFFNDADHKRLSWKADIRIPELDPTILSLSLDIDGQTMRYQHGPVVPFSLTWPGPRGGVHAQITASPSLGPETSAIATDGPWALMRLFHKGRVTQTATLGRTRVVFDFEGRHAALDMVSTGSLANPLASDVLTTFRCPTTMPAFGLPNSGPPPGLPRGPVSVD